MENILYLLPVFGVLGLLFVVWKSAWVNKQDAGTDKMDFLLQLVAVRLELRRCVTDRHVGGRVEGIH